MNDVKTYQLEIFGDKYSLVSDESEDHVVAAAQMVDKYMREIADNVSIKSDQRVAVLAAIRIASMLLQKESELSEQQRCVYNIIEGIKQEVPQFDVS